LRLLERTIKLSFTRNIWASKDKVLLHLGPPRMVDSMIPCVITYGCQRQLVVQVRGLHKKRQSVVLLEIQANRRDQLQRQRFLRRSYSRLVGARNPKVARSLALEKRLEIKVKKR